jgi:ketosteroid isomerase-like protein
MRKALETSGRVRSQTLRRDAATVELVRRFAEAITDRDAAARVAACDPDVVFRSVLDLRGRDYVGHQGIRQYVDDVSSAWEEWRVELHRAAVVPDGRAAVAMTVHARGRLSGAALPVRAGHVWVLRNGRLWRNEPYRDARRAFAAVGAAR